MKYHNEKNHVGVDVEDDVRRVFRLRRISARKGKKGTVRREAIELKRVKGVDEEINNITTRVQPMAANK